MKQNLFKRQFSSFRSNLQKKETSLLIHIPTENYSEKYPLFVTDKSYYDEKTFLENYGNPLYHLLSESLLIIVEKEGDKVVIKYFITNRYRRPGVFWFKVSKSVYFVSVNTKTGNVYSGSIHNYQSKKKKQRKIQCNFFLNDPLKNFSANLKNIITQFNPAEASAITFQVIDIFINSVDGREDLTMGSSNRLFKFYLDKKQIKYPNNFSLFSHEFLGKEFRKILKKSKGKLVEATMIHNKVKGDKLKKVLHEVDRYGFGLYQQAIVFFGENWINQDYNLLYEIIRHQNAIPISNDITTQFVNEASPKELKKFFILFKNFVFEKVVDSNNLSDHIRFYVFLKSFQDNEIEWKSDGSSREEFHEEHLNWANKISYYKGGLYERIYPTLYVETINEYQYNENGIDYFAVLLTNTSDYNEESNCQSNCVRTYIGTASSIIISLRKNSPDSNERLTVEYKIIKNPNFDWIKLDSVQVRAKYNQLPDDSWNGALEKLSELVKKIENTEKNFLKYQLQKTCNNGKILNSNTHFENGVLVWSYKPIDNPYIYYNNYLL